MFHLAYISKASHPMTRHELVNLLAKAKGKNERNGITGLLLHKNGRFVQVLEGEEDVVRPLYDLIRLDHRHTEVTILIEESIAERQFFDWSMGFHDLDSSDILGLYGNSKPLGKSLDIEGFKENPGACLTLLQFVRDLHLTRTTDKSRPPSQPSLP